MWPREKQTKNNKSWVHDIFYTTGVSVLVKKTQVQRKQFPQPLKTDICGNRKGGQNRNPEDFCPLSKERWVCIHSSHLGDFLPSAPALSGMWAQSLTFPQTAGDAFWGTHFPSGHNRSAFATRLLLGQVKRAEISEDWRGRLILSCSLSSLHTTS